ncbi:SdrD B-like domain-containing protein [uncultured Kordia sp.]|uniref:SdrD B-like domain-containing protein n=1 Tax=uncultured Kordia sp. TaxID=507699 RepID=UPI0026031CBB|nr:SdrD B-like domain-containing protein [uncultured Kordia sp.]
MKTLTLSAMTLLFACLTLNAFNFSANKTLDTSIEITNTEENASASVDLNGFLFEFLGVHYNLDGTSTWTYKVTGNGARRNLSHWKLKLLDEHNVISSSPNTWEVHVDPHFQYYGIKWDSSVNKNGGMKTFSFTLDGRYEVGAVDFGYKAGRKLFHGIIQGPTTPLTNAISGTVFNDTNSNGVIDGVEGFLSEVQVNLYDDANANGIIDSGDALLETQITDGVGGYIFSSTTALHVIVEAELPSNTTDYSYEATTALTTSIFLTADDVTNIDFGIKRTQNVFYNISGIVYDDNNQNGIYEGEVGLAAVEVKMYDDANANGTLDDNEQLIATTNTDTNGAYMFTQVMLTHVVVEVVKPRNTGAFEYIATNDVQEAITMLNQNIMDVNFGIDKTQTTNYNISGNVFDDTNANSTIDFGEGALQNITLTLYADHNTNGILDSVDTIIETVVTGADGTYSFLNITIENTLVKITVPQTTTDYTYTLTTDEIVTINAINTDVTNVDFGMRREIISYSVSGNVFNDENGDANNDVVEGGLQGITVNMYEDLNGNGRIDRGEPLIEATVSDRNGNYQFTGIIPSNVIIQILVPSNTADFTYASTTPVSVALNTRNSTTVHFGILRTTVILYNISGVIWDDQNADQIKDSMEDRLSGIVVSLFEDVNIDGILDADDIPVSTITTSATGAYQFSNVNIRNVLVIPTLPANGTFTTLNNRVISSINTNIVDVDFGMRVTDIFYQVTGVVFNDRNENGIADPEEESLNGLPVEIYADSDEDGFLDPNIDALVAFTQTSNGGFGFLDPNYLVDDVPPGDIFVVIILPEDTIFETYTNTYDPDSGTANPDGIYKTVMEGDLFNIDFGVKYTNTNSILRAETGDVIFTNGSAISEAPEDISERLRLYPNPTVKEIAINAEEFSGDVNVEIYNDSGYKVISTTVSQFGSEYKIGVERLAPGMYYAKFQSRNKVASKKFVKK